MTLFSIASKNIKKNFTNYFLYFASMIFSIVIYFTFVSLKYDTTIQSASDASSKISSAFSGASVVLMIFVAIFIWYSNSFFTRKRKKEVGLYSLLGVRKKQIGRMLFYENFLMGILALVIGIVLGLVLSRFFVMFLMEVMGYELISHFSMSLSAVMDTVIVFMIITLLTSVQGYRLIYRFKLIELFHADQEHEREPKTSWITALLSLILIGFGYWIALQNLLQSKVWATLGYMLTSLTILLSIITGTYFLFSTLTVAWLKLSRNRKKGYWKGMNMIGTSQLLYRIKGNARTLTIIAVLSATTLSAVGTSYSFYYNNRSNAEIANPNSMMFIATDSSSVKKVEELVAKSADHKLRYHRSVSVMEMNADISGLKSAFSGGEEMAFTILSAYDFNQLAEVQNRDEELSLKSNEAIVLDSTYMEGMSPHYVGKTITLKDKQQKQQVTLKELHQYNVLNERAVYTTIVVSDNIFGKLKPKTKAEKLEVYGITGQDKAKALTAEVKKILSDKAKFSGFYDSYAAGMEASGLMMFMGGFLGLVFLVATGSILYFKQLAEAGADKGRFWILHKIGVNKKEIRKTVAKQVGFIFALPLIAGIAHCAVALSALSNLVQTNLVIPVVICMGVYTCIYLLYYVLTVNTYYKIVTNIGK